MSYHEHAPLTRHEETELARIGQRLRRDGVRLDRALARPEWPLQLVGVVLAALGGAVGAGALLAAEGAAVVAAQVAVAAIALVAALLLAVTPLRRTVVRSATAIRWRWSGAAAGRGRLRHPVAAIRRRVGTRRRTPT